jgi:hypothetical protein
MSLFRSLIYSVMVGSLYTIPTILHAGHDKLKIEEVNSLHHAGIRIQAYTGQNSLIDNKQNAVVVELSALENSNPNSQTTVQAFFQELDSANIPYCIKWQENASNLYTTMEKQLKDTGDEKLEAVIKKFKLDKFDLGSKIYSPVKSDCSEKCLDAETSATIEKTIDYKTVFYISSKSSHLNNISMNYNKTFHSEPVLFYIPPPKTDSISQALVYPDQTMGGTCCMIQ